MEEVKKTETALVEVKTELQETKKKYVELTIKFTKTQLVGVALFSMLSQDRNFQNFFLFVSKVHYIIYLSIYSSIH